VLKRLTPPLALAGLALLFFAPLVAHPDWVLYADHSDILAEHLPAKRFLAESFRADGELPRWCPHVFSGGPFVHDPQVAAFYPPHLVLYALPGGWVGPALGWLVLFHVVVAGWCAYGYARWRGLGVAAALVAGVGWMFAGRWLLHLLAAGHYITVGLAWLPLVLLCLEKAARGRSLLWATWAGAAFALVVLGTQPQWTFYGGIFLALWSLGAVLAPPHPQPLAPEHRGEGGKKAAAARLAWWLGCGAWAAAVAVALAAVQLLPTLEAAGASTRAAGVNGGDALDGGLRALLFVAGPALTTEPANLEWEDRGAFGVLWLAAAACAPLLWRGRVRYEAGVGAALLLFAFGGSALFQSLPGFSLFRQPARMLVVAALPVALLAANTVQALLDQATATEAARRRCRWVLLRVLAAVALLAGGFAIRQALAGRPLRFHVYWPALLLTVPAALGLLRRPGALRPAALALAWGAILLLDLWALTGPLVAVRSEEEIYPASDCVEFLARHTEGHPRVLDRDADEGSSGTPLGAGAPVALLRRLEPVRGYNPLDNRRYKEYLQFIADEDRPLRPLDGALTFPVLRDFPVRNKELLDLLGVRYLVQPASKVPEGDGWRRVCADRRPRAYNFIDGGVEELPPYAVWENTTALPRAFVVPRAAPLPARAEVLPTLKAADFRQVVLLEGWDGEGAGAAETFRQAAVRDHRPNRVEVATDGAAGWLVLADVWHPGWRAAVDGEPARVYRADFLFRAVRVPAGSHEVVFTFEPESYRRGRAVSLAALAGVVGLGLGAGVWKCLRRVEAMPRATPGRRTTAA